MPIQNEFLDKFTKQLIIESAPIPIMQKLNELKKKYKQSEIENKQTKPREIINQGIKKLAPLLSNTNITMIECLGPQKYLIIEKENKRNPVLMSLSNQEIKEVIEYFAKKTNNPITKQTYKTTLNNMVLTSINSEFGGKKFIITKTMSEYSRFL